MTGSRRDELERMRRGAAELCFGEFEFSHAVAAANGWETGHDKVHRTVFFEIDPDKDTVAAEFTCLFARGSAAVLACGLEPGAEGCEPHPGMEADMLSTVSGSLKIVRDLADLGRLNPDDRLLAGDGERLWHEAKRQEEALEALDRLLEEYGTTLDKFASLPVIVSRLGADGLPETDLDKVRAAAAGSRTGEAVATCIELACRQIGEADGVPTSGHYQRDSTAIDIAAAFWSACGKEVCRIFDAPAPAQATDAPAP